MGSGLVPGDGARADTKYHVFRAEATSRFTLLSLMFRLDIEIFAASTRESRIYIERHETHSSLQPRMPEPNC